ncbi:unnamed protein product [Ixodes pacificus]
MLFSTRLRRSCHCTRMSLSCCHWCLPKVRCTVVATTTLRPVWLILAVSMRVRSASTTKPSTSCSCSSRCSTSKSSSRWVSAICISVSSRILCRFCSCERPRELTKSLLACT